MMPGWTLGCSSILAFIQIPNKLWEIKGSLTLINEFLILSSLYTSLQDNIDKFGRVGSMRIQALARNIWSTFRKQQCHTCDSDASVPKSQTPLRKWSKKWLLRQPNMVFRQSLSSQSTARKNLCQHKFLWSAFLRFRLPFACSCQPERLEIFHFWDSLVI